MVVVVPSTCRSPLIISVPPVPSGSGSICETLSSPDRSIFPSLSITAFDEPPTCRSSRLDPAADAELVTFIFTLVYVVAASFHVSVIS